MTRIRARRACVALALAVILPVPTSLVAHASAAPNRGGAQSPLARQMLTSRSPLAATAVPRHFMTLRPASTHAAPAQTVTDPTKAGFTPPANAIQPKTSTVDVAFANDNTKSVFAALNGGKYDTAGMTSGYSEVFSLPIGSGSDTVDVAYLATLYGTADQAAARVTATQQYLASRQLTGQPCGTSCFVYALQFPDSNGRTIALDYTIWSNDNVVAELAFFVYQDVFTANANAFGTITQTVIGLAVAAVPVQQAVSALTIVGFALAHTVKKTAKLTKKLKSGEAGIFVADVQYPNAGDTVQAQITFTIGKKTVGPLLLGNPQSVSSTEEVLGGKHKFKVKKTTKVVAHLLVQDGTAKATQDLTFKVTA